MGRRHRFATNGDVLRKIDSKLIADCTPCVEVSEDEGPFPIIGSTEEEQPVMVSWSLLLHSHGVIEMACVMENIIVCREDRKNLFHVVACEPYAAEG